MTKKFYQIETADDGTIKSLQILGSNKETPIEVGTVTWDDSENGKSIIRAASSFFKFGRYDHPDTVVNLHIYKGVPRLSKVIYHQRVGVVSADYKGEFVIDGGHMNPNNFIDGWADVYADDEKFYTRKFKRTDDKPEGPEMKAMKHKWVNYILRGYSFNIWTFPYSNYVKVFLEQWDAPMEEALAMLSTKLDEVKMKETVEAAVNRAYRLNDNKAIPTNTPLVDRATGEVNASIILIGSDGKNFDLNDIEPPMMFEYHDGKSTRFSKWDGTYQSRLRFEVISAKCKDEGWTVDVPKILQ